MSRDLEKDTNIEEQPAADDTEDMQSEAQGPMPMTGEVAAIRAYTSGGRVGTR